MSGGKENLRSLGTLPKEERVAIASRGGKKSGEVYRRKKSLKELTETILNTRVKSSQARKKLKELFPDLTEEELTNGLALTAKILCGAIESDSVKDAVKAAEYLRDTSGQKPDLKITADESTRTVFVTEKEKKNVINHINSVINEKE